jgi:hypothetical protein
MRIEINVKIILYIDFEIDHGLFIKYDVVPNQSNTR